MIKHIDYWGIKTPLERFKEITSVVNQLVDVVNAITIDVDGTKCMFAPFIKPQELAEKLK